MKRPKKIRKHPCLGELRALKATTEQLATTQEALHDAVKAIDAQTVSRSWTWADVERLDRLRALARRRANR